jgi:hypothetical protein
MSSLWDQVGQFSQTVAQSAGQIGHSFGQTIGNSVNQAIQQGLSTAVVQEELRIGSHTVMVKEKLAEGSCLSSVFSFFIFFLFSIVGGFGLVVLVTDIHTQKDMVLKRCNIDREEIFKVVKKEISILQKFAGPYVTKLIDSDIATVRSTSREALLLLEYYSGGHLLSRLNTRNGQPLPAESVYRIFGQILMGVRTFHENNPPIINRDFKLENILFGPVIKIAWFFHCSFLFFIVGW